MKELFDQLRADAQRQPLPEPAALRVRSDRRAARRMATGVTAVVLALTGGFVALQPGSRSGLPIADPTPTLTVQPTPSRTPPSPTPSPTAAASPADKTCRDRFPKQLPNAIFAQASFGDGLREICFDPVDALFFMESIPQPCRPQSLESDKLIEDRRGFTTMMEETYPGDTKGPTMLDQTVTRYSGQGARDFISQLKAALSGCGPVRTKELQVTYNSTTVNDSTLHLKVEYRRLDKPEVGPDTSTYLVVVHRVGTYVAVVYDKGWEGIPSKPETVLGLANALAERIPT